MYSRLPQRLTKVSQRICRGNCVCVYRRAHRQYAKDYTPDKRHENMYLEGVIFEYRTQVPALCESSDNQIGSELYMFRYYPKSLLSATEFLSKM